MSDESDRREDEFWTRPSSPWSPGPDALLTLLVLALVVAICYMMMGG